MTSRTAILDEVLPVVRALSRADKLRLIQELAGEMIQEDGVSPLEPGAAYPVWSPHDAFDAAAALQQLLDAERKGA